MAKNPELIVKIGANDKEFERTLSGLSAKSTKSMKALKVGAIGAAIAFTALAAGAAAAVQEFRNFERTFSNVVTLLDESSFKTKSFNDGVGDMKKGLLELRAQTGQSFDSLNKGLFDLVSAGVDAEKAIDTLRIATDLALAGATDASVAVDGLTSAMNAYGFEADKAQEISEKFFTAQKFGKTTIAELSTDFGKVAAAANAMGISFDEVLASVSAATLAGIKTNEAYTGLKAVISNIIKPSKDAADEADRLGINFDSSSLKAKGFKGFLDSITSSAKFNSNSLEKLFGSMEAVNIALALTGAQAEDFDKILVELGDETKRAGTFQDALATKSETVDEKFKKLAGSADALKVEIGERLSPAFGNFADNAANSLDYVREHLDDLEKSLTSFFDTLVDTQLAFTKFLVETSGAKFPEPANFTPINFEDQPNFTPFNPDEAIADIERIDDAKIKSDEIDKKLAEGKALREQERRDEEERLAEEKAEKDEEKRQEKLEREAEQFEQDLELLTERLSGIDKLEAQFQGLAELRELQELKKKAKTAKQKEAIDKQIAIASKKYTELQTRAAIEGLGELLGTSSEVGKAVFLLNKAFAIADTITTTQNAAMRAYASQLIPGDPTSIARAQAASFATKIKGAINVGIIGATAIQGITGAAEGGIVQGGVFGRDTEPFMLAKDEIILPSKVNPLSPNFDDTFGGGGVGQQNVNVEIGFDEDASRMLTIKQREDSALGIQR